MHHHFFEFIDEASWNEGRRDCLTLSELTVGRRYYVLFTTVAGLYRYFMNDLVDVTGMFNRTPLLRFVQKGRGVTSLTGEKLYEAQVIEAVQDVARDQGFTTSFFLLIADEQRAAYQLYVETDSSVRLDAEVVGPTVDARLGMLNVEYETKRASGRLGALTLSWLSRGTADAYKAAALRTGQREGQFKPAILIYRKDLMFSFDEHVIR